MQKLGQHFLASETIAKRIVGACELEKNDTVIEIGPGHGELTQHYIELVAKVCLIEADKKLADGLGKKWGNYAHAQLVEGDFRKLDLSSLVLESPPVVLSNLPYYASKPILAKLLTWAKYKRAVLMIQKELAQRLTAQAGDSNFGAFSLFFQIHAVGKILFDVPKEAFRPRPKVTSSIIWMEPKSTAMNEKDKEDLNLFIHRSFQHRRKTLANNLTRQHWKRPKIEEILSALGVRAKARPQEISLEMYSILFEKLRSFPDMVQ